MTKTEQLKVPECLNNSFFEKVLRNGLKVNEVTVKDTTIKIATSAGDNYCSDIYRVKLNYSIGKNGKPEQISLIIKSMPFLEHRGPVLEDYEVFDKEVEMYTKTLPRLSAMLGNETLSAKCYYATRDPFNLIVFEDLGEKGFVMADRHNGLDFEHCSLLLKLMAQLHAASHFLAQREPESMVKYDFGLLKANSNDDNLINGMLRKGILALSKVASSWPDYHDIAKKLNGFSVSLSLGLLISEQTSIDFVSSSLQSQFVCILNKKIAQMQTESEFKVLNHGDSWVNNFMYRYIEGRPVSAIYVDYQMSYYASPGIDFNYFIHTSPSVEVRENRYDELVDVYYEQLTISLDQLKAKQIPRIETIRKEIKRCNYYALMTTIAVLPIIVLDKKASETSSMETLGDEEASEKQRQMMFNGENYQRAVKPILKRFDNSKLFDEFVSLA